MAFYQPAMNTPALEIPPWVTIPIYGCSRCQVESSSWQVTNEHVRRSNKEGSYYTCPACHGFASCDANAFVGEENHASVCALWDEWKRQGDVKTEEETIKYAYSPYAKIPGVASVILKWDDPAPARVYRRTSLATFLAGRETNTAAASGPTHLPLIAKRALDSARDTGTASANLPRA